MDFRLGGRRAGKTKAMYEEAKVLRLQPGDSLVFSFARPVPRAVVERLREEFEGHHPNVKLLVLAGGEVTVIREAKP